MSLYEKLIAKEAVLAVVGLGYVGMPIAVAFAKKGLNVIGFDTNSKKIEAYRSGADRRRKWATSRYGTPPCSSRTRNNSSGRPTSSWWLCRRR